MWRRILSSQLQSLASSSSAAAAASRSASRVSSVQGNGSLVGISRAPATAFFARHFSSGTENEVSKPKMKVEDVMPIATGHEREELEAMLEGKDVLEINHPVGPFGTKEEPAVVKSYYDKRIVGCPGGEGEDEHDVVWFWLEKDKPFECPVCSQYFVLEVVGPGGPPDGHGDDDEEESSEEEDH